MGGLDLLPALGRALECAALLGGARFRNPPAIDRPVHAVGRVALPRTGRIVRTGILAPRDSAPSGNHTQATRRTANGSRPRAPWARLTTIPVPWRPVKAGSLTVTARGQHRPPGRTTPGSTVRRPVVFLVRGTLPGSPGSAADRTAPGAW